MSENKNLVEFSSGAVRGNDLDGLRYDLISPIALRALAAAYGEGEKKYGAFNCEKGMPIHNLLNHAIAHIFNFLSGDRSEDHLGHAMWNVGMSIHSLEMWPNLNNDMLRSEGCVAPDVPVRINITLEDYINSINRAGKVECNVNLQHADSPVYAPVEDSCSANVSSCSATVSSDDVLVSCKKPSKSSSVSTFANENIMDEYI